jgi:cellulose synthase/poly-beta-1,6-N-acetylglucosamine synthase-like glycosyltransferase
MSVLADAYWAFGALAASTRQQSWVDVALKFFPIVLLVELPLYLLVVAGIVRYGLRQWRPHRQRERYPSVSCIVTCYGEGRDVEKTMRSLAHQVYPGEIEIIAVVDGALRNAETLRAAQGCAAEIAPLPARRLIVLPKWQRGGRVSSLNAGLSIASGDVLMSLDGDTSFDNDMVGRATRHFDDPNVVGVAGCIRVRNAGASIASRLQALEYMLSIGAGKTGLSEFNLVNNISGAFGVFRASMVRHIGGWDAGTAEDLDITLRLKQYFGRHPELRIAFEPHAVGHTDAPTSFGQFFKQRLRWEGDLYYLFVRKFRHNLRPGLLGWRNFFYVLVNGLFLQVTMPFVLVAYTMGLAAVLPLGAILGIMAFVYLGYLVALALYFALYVLIVSERPAQDLHHAVWLPVFPLFAFAARVHSAVAILQEMVLKSHLDSSMAPWWVLRRTKF